MEKREVTINIRASTFAILVLIGGLVLYYFSEVVGNWKWAEAGGELVRIFATTLISTGALSIILEISSIKSCVEEAIKNLLSGNFPLNSCSKSTINRLFERVCCAKGDIPISINDLSKSIYCLEPHLYNLINKIYFLEHCVKTYITPTEDKLHKKVIYKAKIINPYKSVNKLQLEWSLANEDKIFLVENRQTAVSITKMRINGIDITNKVNECMSVSKSENEHEKYPYKVSFIKDLGTEKETVVELRYEYDVMPDDLTQSFKLTKPCKKLEHEIHIENDDSGKWALSANGFASFYESNSELKDKYLTENMTDTSCRIAFDEWAIPGAGYVVSFNKKC